MAERKGFEPSTHCCEHAFQASALNHSATSPKGGLDLLQKNTLKTNFNQVIQFKKKQEEVESLTFSRF